ncbi:MAG: hypothetical protein HY048_19565 [Acidobacteria bacterium]|nr:hypothetical protein [Acidobacteriota bacterium]
MKHTLTAGVGVVLAGASVAAGLAAGRMTPASRVEIKTLSTAATRVTGGDVLVQVTAPAGTSTKMTVGERDVSNAFRAGASSTARVGLITGLANGKNVVEVRSKAGGPPDASLTITNYPITGPVFSGPQIQPFICQTDTFKLPDGTTLGPPLDANCSAKTVVQYVYRTTGTPPAFKPLTTLASVTLPPDLATTTTSAGATVNFIVRVETGTMNRAIYQNAILHDPTVDAPVSPFSPPKGWNKHLVAIHGAGCPGGWYIQGGAMGTSPLDAARLGEGDALFVSTLNHPTNSCNAIVAGETAMMGKEHFIETFGMPAYTISTGSSGGAYTSLQLADAFPGLFDGVSIAATFPDALSIALAGLDAHLLTHYFASLPTGPTSPTSPTRPAFTDAQKLAITGYSTIKAFVDAANQSQRTDPVPNRADIEGYQSARWNAVVPENLRYDPMNNPRGARPTVFDVARNVYGTNTATGFALRPYDNVGVQYGLHALNRGAITSAQFLDLNERIGGVDQDSNYIASRTIGDAGAIARTYQSGLLLSGKGGLASIPIVDNATSNEAGGYHYGWFHYALRERLSQANGNSDNLVMWRSTVAADAKAMFDTWMAAYAADTSNDPQRTKVLRAKPANAVEGCYDKSTPPVFMAEHLVFTSQPTTKCSALYPVYSNTRTEAGGSVAGNVLKCRLKPIDPKDYKVTFSADERARLNKIFSGGVCDWSKPGVNQAPVVAWPSVGPSPEHLLIDGAKTTTSPGSPL